MKKMMMLIALSAVTTMVAYGSREDFDACVKRCMKDVKDKPRCEHICESFINR